MGKVKPNESDTVNNVILDRYESDHDDQCQVNPAENVDILSGLQRLFSEEILLGDKDMSEQCTVEPSLDTMSNSVDIAVDNIVEDLDIAVKSGSVRLVRLSQMDNQQNQSGLSHNVTEVGVTNVLSSQCTESVDYVTSVVDLSYDSRIMNDTGVMCSSMEDGDEYEKLQEPSVNVQNCVRVYKARTGILPRRGSCRGDRIDVQTHKDEGPVMEPEKLPYSCVNQICGFIWMCVTLLDIMMFCISEMPGTMRRTWNSLKRIQCQRDVSQGHDSEIFIGGQIHPIPVVSNISRGLSVLSVLHHRVDKYSVRSGYTWPIEPGGQEIVQIMCVELSSLDICIKVLQKCNLVAFNLENKCGFVIRTFQPRTYTSSWCYSIDSGQGSSVLLFPWLPWHRTITCLVIVLLPWLPSGSRSTKCIVTTDHVVSMVTLD